MVGFGLDLSGYSGGKTSLAFVEIAGDVARAVILRGSAFSKPRHGVDDAPATIAAERKALAQCMEIASVAVDVPIDLQGLLTPREVAFIWELTKRPVDYAFGALAPLADRLGSCVARFRAIISTEQFRAEVGRRIFETYPAASLGQLALTGKGYKGDVGSAFRALLCRTLGCDRHDLSDHDLDAIICGMTVAAPAKCRLEGSRLVQAMHLADSFTGMTPSGGEPPIGYVILERWPTRRLNVSVADFDSWIHQGALASAENRTAQRH
jgi:hypothetical protein